MEDPIRFDIWVQVERSYKEGAIVALTESRPELGALEVRKLANASVMRREWILVVRGVSWSAITSFRTDPPRWCKMAVVYQEGYGLHDEQPDYCAKHRLYYGGCLGCHVCAGYYAA